MALIWVKFAAELLDNFLLTRVEFGSSSALRFTQGIRNGEWGWGENRRRR
jgi:hypothetical protein